MRKLLSFIFILGLAISCGTPKQNGKPIVTVSILPQKYFVEKIIGDFAEVQVLVPSGASPATYSLLPSQMKSLSKSDVWLRIGHIGFEEVWHENIEQANSRLKVYDTSALSDLITGEEEHGDHEHHHGIDPHIWMSPREVAKIAELTWKALVEIYPEKQEIFTDNYTLFQLEVSELDQALLQQFEGVQNRRFLIFHPALSYLARAYGLEQIALELDGKEPSPKYMSNLVDQAKADSIRVVFIQKEFDRDNARQLAVEIGGKVVQIDPLSENWDEQIREIAHKITEASK